MDGNIVSPAKAMADGKRVTHDYVSRLGERTGLVWGKKLITLPDDLHECMVDEAAKLSIPMYEAYIQAARLWLKSRGMTGTFKGSPLTGDEEEFVNAVLGLYQNRRQHECADAVDIIKKLIKLVKPIYSTQPPSS
jgi:hypothetical protein